MKKDIIDKYGITKDIPLDNNKFTRHQEIIDVAGSIDTGTSFVLSKGINTNSPINALTYVRKAHPDKKFVSRTISKDSIRVWRTE